MRTLTGAQLARLLPEWPGGTHRNLAHSLAERIHGLLLDGRLPAGVRVPAERDLAQALAVSRTTVTAAYGMLRDAGYLDSRRGAGSWTVLPVAADSTDSTWGPAAGSGTDVLDLAVAALPAPPELLDAVDRASCELPRHLSGTGYHPLGLEPLRQAVAARYTRRGLPTSADQILVTNGAQHALELVLRLLVAPGEAVLVESPSYPNALDAIRRARARTVPYGLGRTGWDAELVESAMRQSAPRLAYLIADFHNPTGRLMDAGTREHLAAAAHRCGVDILVDETFAELQLDGGAELPAPLAAFDRHGRVLTSGTMSKAFWGGLRVGWIRAAPPLVRRLAAVRAGVDLASPVLEQLIAAELLSSAELLGSAESGAARPPAAAPAASGSADGASAHGSADGILAQRRWLLAGRRRALVDALRADLPEWRFDLPAGGMSLWAELPHPVSSALCRAALAHRVRVAPGPRFGADGTLERFVRLPFTLPPADLAEAVRRLAAAGAELDRPRSTAAGSPLVT